MRLIYIRLVAVYFFITGLWNIYSFQQVVSTSGTANLGYLVNAYILINGAIILFSLKEFGRKLALFIIGMNILVLIFKIYLAISIPFSSFNWTGLGTSFHSSSKPLYFGLVIFWLLNLVFCGAILLSNKTRAIFTKQGIKFSFPGVKAGQ